MRESGASDLEADVEVVVEPVKPVDDSGSGNTKAYYLPSEPRRPAAPTPPPPPKSTPAPPDRAISDQPPPPSELVRRTIAEAFQEMLRQAFAAGAAAARTGEAFEVWYQREVLR